MIIYLNGSYKSFIKLDVFKTKKKTNKVLINVHGLYATTGDRGFEAKQAIVRKVVDTIVGTQHDIKVYGHLALNSSIIANVWKGGIQDVKFETSSRNRRFTKCGKEHTF